MLGAAAPDRLTALAVAYLLAPAVVFLGTWPAGWAAALAVPAALAAGALVPGWRGTWPLTARATAACLALGLLWAGTSGMHHLLYSTVDWQIRDAVLRDLVTYAWPIHYVIGGETWLLRAPIGYYLPAALVGWLGGLGGAQAALWAWTGVGIGLVFALLRTLAPEARAFAWMVALFVAFGGLEFAVVMLWDALRGAEAPARFAGSLEWWAELFQYSSHVTLVLWVPNHALPPWIAALLLLRHARVAGFLRAGAVPLAAGAFWSPVGAAGAAVLYGVALLRGGVGPALLRTAFAPPNLLAVAVAVPLCLYLVAGAAAIRHGVLLALHPGWRTAGLWLAFVLVEVLAWAALAALRGVRGALFAASVVMLCLLPGYVFGPGNEMTMRGGIAALAVLAVAAGLALAAPAETRAARRARAGLLACGLIAAAGAAYEARVLVTREPWPLSAHCSLPEAARQSVFSGHATWDHYLARWPDPTLAPWLAAPGARVAEPRDGRPCWPRPVE